MHEYGPVYLQSSTQFFMTSTPVDYFDDLNSFLNNKGVQHRVSGTNMKTKYLTRLQDESEVEVQIEVLTVSDSKNCTKFNFRDPATKVDINNAAVIQHFMEVRDASELRMFCDTTFEEM